MTPEIVSQDLKTVLRRLKLGRMLDTLPERITLARQQQMPHQDFLLLVLSDEASPIGAFLSGGIDSSAVVAFMSRHSSQPVKTYSIGFHRSTGAQLYNELPYARQVAAQFGTDHHEIVVQPDVATLLPDLIWHMDEPISDAAFITTYLVSKFAREDVTVILSGVGGDELFGGYKRYLDEHYRSGYRRIPAAIRSVGVIAPLARLLPSDRHSRVLNQMRLAKAFLLADQLPFDERYRAYMQVFDAAERAALLRGGVPATFEDCIARDKKLKWEYQMKRKWNMIVYECLSNTGFFRLMLFL